MTIGTDYIAAQPVAQQKQLNKLYQILTQTLPMATEQISYGIPTFFVNEQPVVYFRANKTFIGFYPTAAPIVRFADELTDFTVTKGSIHLPYDKPLPSALVKRIVTFRLREVTAGKTSRQSGQPRPRHPMPQDVQQALADAKLVDRYDARPQYQRNDYIGWISQAKRPTTRQKRLDQMLMELKAGNVYMKMAWRGRKK